MEKRNDPPAVPYRRGLMDALLRRRDPSGDEPFDSEEEEEYKSVQRDDFTL